MPFPILEYSACTCSNIQYGIGGHECMQRRNSITNFNSLLIWMCTNGYSDHKSKSGLFLKQIITSSNLRAGIQQKCKRKWHKKAQIREHASYVKIPPEEPGWRIVTFETAPLAERTHIPRGPFWAKERIFPATSCKPQSRDSIS